MLEFGVWLLSALLCGSFFAWVTRNLLRLRKHAHDQNNVLHRILLQSEEHGTDLAALRDRLGIPRAP